MNKQQVILVNEADEPTGFMDKLEAHQKALLHRAFSVFIFNSRGEMLLQQRAEYKYHSPGLWTNACCSHPSPGEETLKAAKRRLQEELGFTTELTALFSFVYKHDFDNGLSEYEFDHVFTGIYNGEVFPDNTEVKDYAYRQPAAIAGSLSQHPEQYTVWFAMAFPRVKEWADKQRWA